MKIKKKFISLVLPFLAIYLISLSFVSSGLTPGKAQGIKTHVLYISNSQGKTLDAISLDSDNIVVTMQKISEISLNNLSNFDIVVLNDVNLTQTQLITLSSWTKINGHGLIIIMGPTLTKGNQILSTFNFTSVTQFENNMGDVDEEEDPGLFNKLKGISIASTEESLKSHPILATIVWNTAPETFYWTLVPDLKDDVQIYVEMQWNDADLNAEEEQDYPMIAGVRVGENEGENIFLLSGWFQKEYENVSANEHFMIWPFYNYLLFATIQSSVGRPVPIYGEWRYSAVPHYEEQLILGVIVLITAVGSVWAFYRVRKERDKLPDYFTTSDIAVLKTAPEEDIYIDKEDDWEVVGFHRQLSGFLKLYFLMMLLIIPQLLISSILMPQFINPYPQSNGWYSYTLHFFEAIWLIFDLGFNYAIIRFFAQHRIERPEKAYHYVQLFIWWEILSGVVQIGLVAFVGSIVFPLTDFNYLSWMFVIHSMIQFPGIFLVFQYFFQGTQRADYQMIAFALQSLVLRLILQVITVPIFKAIYQDNVQYGAAFGTSIGLLVGQLLGDWALFFITWRMYKSLKLPSRPIFGAGFSKTEFLETFKFGMKMAVGEMLVPLVWLLQVYLVVIYIPNSSQEQGYFELAWTISQVPMAIVLMTSALLGALTEAHEYNKENLLNYNTISGFRWGILWTLYLSAAFLAISETFIIGASGPLWIRSAQLLPLFLFLRILGPPSWMCDQAFPAANKPIYATISWIIEQGLRAVLMIIFLNNFHIMEAVLWAYIISLTVKDIFVIITLRIKVHKWDWNPWPSYIAPFLSAGMVYLVFKLFELIIVDVIGLGQGLISAIFLLILVLFAGEFLHSFFYALFGGYDVNTLDELARSSNMVTGVGFFARFYYKCAAIGARISPLHDKFPITVYEAAQIEAAELTAIKRKIVL